MNNNRINPHDTIYNITEQYPETISVLVAFGFDKLQNPMMRSTIGKTMTLQTACNMKHVDLQPVIDQMEAVVAGDELSKITVKGILPCPIRIPLIDKIDTFIEENKLNVDYTLPAASTGLDWLIEETGEKEALADIYLSAGFGLFFDPDKIGEFVNEGIFRSEKVTYNSEFQNFVDPRYIYTILGVVPAVFMVNKQLLGDRKMPTKWSDLLAEEYRGEIAVPMKDLDLFNALLLGLYTVYGEDAIVQLGANVIKNMHPAEMVKNASQNKTPCISVAPYFFASMLGEQDIMQAVWPEDGAVASPIFLISKEETYENYAPFLEFLKSKEIGEILSSNGKFPSTILGVDNKLGSEQSFIFSGFEFINHHNIVALLEHLEKLFYGRESA